MRDVIQFLPSLIWLLLVPLLLLCILTLVFSTRVFYVQARFAWWNRGAANPPGLEPYLLLAAISSISAVLVFGLTAREDTNLRLALMGVAAATTWVLFDWLIRQIIAWTLSMDAETRQWRDKAQAAGEALRAIREPNAIRPTTTRLLREGLGAKSASLYVRGSEDFMPVHHDPSPPSTPVVFGGQSLLAKELARFPGPHSIVTARGGRPLAWSKGPAIQLAVEQEQLRAMEAHLIVPLVVGRVLSGFYLFGPPEAAGSYSSAAIRYAEAVVRQSTDRLFYARQAQELAELRAAEARRAASQEFGVSARKYLLPPESVELGQVEFAVGWWGSEHNRPLFYDVIALPRRAAGLLLAEIEAPERDAVVRFVQLQALIRSRFRAYDEDLSAMLSSVRRALTWPEGAPPVRLFVARFNPESQSLTYVNAGFCPPMLLRRSETGADLLRLQGQVSPLDPKCESAWMERPVRLGNGDMMVIANDAVTRIAGTDDAEPWSEGRLIDTLLGWEDQPIGDLVGLARKTIEEREGPLAAAAPPRVLMVLRARQRQVSLVE
ncbi:MAG: SpoIIE family protein phosphatase [Bryobacteraceae bacterium]|nr:SpoIIE family protein phosphatase [Bryobacteraceae bacterium]